MPKKFCGPSIRCRLLSECNKLISNRALIALFRPSSTWWLFFLSKFPIKKFMLSNDWVLSKFYDSCYQFELIVSSAIKRSHFPSRPRKPCSATVHVIRNVTISQLQSLTQRFILITMINLLCDQRLQVFRAGDAIAPLPAISRRTTVFRRFWKSWNSYADDVEARSVRNRLRMGTCETPSCI